MAEVTEWHVVRIQAGAGETEGVYRVTGAGRDGNAASGWSLILKILQSSSPQDEVWRWNYQQREWHFYRSGLLKGQHGLVAPRCLGVMHRKDGRTWLWLEDVADDDGTWPLARYGLSAYHLGRFSGRFSSGGALPDYPWLSRRWLRGWLEEAAPAIARLRLLRNDPAVQGVYDDADSILQLWDEREKRLSVLEHCPQTLCHLDAHRRNMFSRRSAGEEGTVLIDWAFVGVAAVGEDLASLVSATIAMGEVALGDMKRLEATVLDGYLEGLRDAGCSTDPELVHMAYSMAASLRFPVGAVRLVLPMLLDPGQHRDVEQLHHGTPVEALFDRWGAMNRHLIRLGDVLAD
ncbi:phosphotransferase [Arthrobacter sp. ISL-65]|uniref:phosphotransferase n=1 Tax=Arthrobacter sp. ISL-65 TaxID=2819112 RepID=UPI001BEC9C64|nr:phosphotransferase [Arthrobacter sp. ISL-65]MBT2550971.1 phosphotransferase [Arthrobacter sp. ISL-65]